MGKQYSCYYCGQKIEEGHVHMTHLYEAEHPQDEPLCDECYGEWLEGIKE